LLEDRTTPSALNWTGWYSSDWSNALNWTDYINSTIHAVPGAADTAIIRSSPHDPVLSSATTVGGLLVYGGNLTLGANLSDAGVFWQTGGSIGYAGNGLTLSIEGWIVSRSGGTFLDTSGPIVGNVVFTGHYYRLTDTSNNLWPNLIINDSVTGIFLDISSHMAVTNLTLPAQTDLTIGESGGESGSLYVAGTFTDNGMLSLTQSVPGDPAPVTVGGTLALAGTSVFDLTVGPPATSGYYELAAFGTLTDNPNATYVVHGAGTLNVTPIKNPRDLGVQLGATFDWTGGFSNDWTAPQNWTDRNGNHGVPTAADTVIIHGAPYDPILSANATVANLILDTGYLRLNASLTVTGSYSQGGCFVGFGASTDVLTIDGDVTRTGGEIFVANGNVVLNGTSTQTVRDVSDHPLPNLTIANPAGVTLTADSRLVVTGLDVSGGSLTLNSDVTDTGTFTQEGGSVSYNASVGLTVEGDISRTGGTFISAPGVAGTVVLAGQPSQHITDTTGSSWPDVTITNDNVTGVIVNAGSHLSVADLTLSAASTLNLQGTATLAVGGTFTDNGKLFLNQPASGGAAPVTVGGTLALAGTTAFDLTIGSPAIGNYYDFVMYGTLTDNASATYILRGTGTLNPALDKTAPNLGVRFLSAATSYNWTGAVSSDWSDLRNWTKDGTPGVHAVPVAADTVRINGGPHDPVVTPSTSVAGIVMGNGFLTINGTLTDTGTFNQSEGFLAFGAGGRLQIAGDVTRTGGRFLGSAGTVVLMGGAQNFSDTSNHPVPNLDISNGSAVTIPSGSHPAVSGSVSVNGSLTLADTATLNVGGTLDAVGHLLLTQNTPNGGAASAPLQVGTLEVNAHSLFDLTVGGALASGNVYTYFSGPVVFDEGYNSVRRGNFAVHGSGAFLPEASLTTISLTVATWSTYGGPCDTWNGGVDSDFSNNANWSTGYAPSVHDTVLIQNAPHDPVLGANIRIFNLGFSGGLLTVGPGVTLTDEEGVSVDDGSLTLAGGATLNVSRDVEVRGNLTLAGGATLNVGGKLDAYGHLFLTQNLPNGAAPLQVRTMEVDYSSTFDLTVGGAPANGSVYTFFSGSVVDYDSVPAGNLVAHANGAFFPVAVLTSTSLTVTTLSTPRGDIWTGGTDSDFSNNANWSTGRAPGLSDTVVIQNAPHNPVVGANTAVGKLLIAGGILTVGSGVTLTDAGDYTQVAGSVGYGNDSSQLQIAGNVFHTGGGVLGSAGTVVLMGGAPFQEIVDTSGQPFGWNVTVNGVIQVATDSILQVANNFTNNGSVDLFMRNSYPPGYPGASPTPLQIGNNLVEGVGSAFHLGIGHVSYQQIYVFITFGGTDWPLNSTVDNGGWPSWAIPHHVGVSPITISTGF
jgi:hypothetical protein